MILNIFSSIQIIRTFLGIRTFCPLGHILIWGYYNILSWNIRQEKLTEFMKIFELYQVSMHNVLCQNIWIFSNYILLARKINTFWSGINISVRDIKSLCAKLFWTFSYIYFGTKCLKKLNKKNFELYQVFLCWIVLNILRQNISKIRQEKF